MFGSIAKGTDTANSDVDLMIIGDGLDYLEAYGAVREAEAVLNRPVNPTIYSLQEFRKRQRERQCVSRESAGRAQGVDNRFRT